MTNPERHYKLIRIVHIPLLLLAVAVTSLFVHMLLKNKSASSRSVSLPICEVSSNFIIRSNDLGLAMRVAEEAEYALESIRQELLSDESEMIQKVEIYLWNTSEEYQKSAPHILAGSTGCSTYIDLPGGGKLWRIDLLDYTPGSRVLAHEISHVLLSHFNEKARKAGQKPIPLALHEGVAMMAEGIVHDDYLMTAAISIAKDIKADEDVLARLLEATDDFDWQMTMEEKADFYAKSYSLAEFLRQNLKKEGFKEFLAHVCRGKSVDKAFSLAANLEQTDMKLVRKGIIRGWSDHALSNARISLALNIENQ